jgi:dCMP deaminase
MTLNKDQEKWDLRFLALAKFISTWSKDPSTQVGAVIFDKDNRIISMGYNGYPTGVPDEDLENRERKYKTIIHAETNAIIFAKRDLSDCQIATYPFMPCSNCSSAIIQSGIKRVIYPRVSEEKALRWGDSFGIALEQFRNAGVEVTEYFCEDN